MLSTVRADKKDKFIVSTRFNGHAIVYLNRGSDLLEDRLARYSHHQPVRQKSR